MFRNMFRLKVPSKSMIRNIFGSKSKLENDVSLHDRILNNITNDVCLKNTTTEVEFSNSKKIVKEVLNQLNLSNSVFGKNSIVGKDVFIGNNVVIENGAVISKNTSIGVNSKFGTNINVGNKVTIGDRAALGDDMNIM